MAVSLTPEAREALILEHIPLAKRHARRRARVTPPNPDFDRHDLEQMAMLALITAVDTWDGVAPFEAYANFKIPRELVSTFRDADMLLPRERLSEVTAGTRVHHVESLTDRERHADEWA